ncbi:MAG: hypothetical protein GY796_04495 [Chloroflexi bacterium]|nr:hypothetical protein [Chloroflexota bacterium]
MSDHWIRASELSAYIYCRRAWWLKRKKGARSQNIRELETGTQHHERHGHLVWQSIWAKRLAFLMLFVAIIILIYIVF